MKGYKKVFLVAAFITLGVIGMLVLAGITAYNTFVYDDGNKVEASQKGMPGEAVETTPEGENVSEETQRKINKTVAIFGTDITGGLTDVIFVANFDSETKEVNVVAIPRDTKVDWSEEQIAILPRQHQWIRTGKINEMTSWGGIENIRPLTITTMEQLLGTKIDEYVVVSLNAFREIVDAIGGVEVEVKQRMKKDDYSQNLHIDLYPGVQLLYGNKAEQFVRFRSYKNGDLGRIEAQQQFLTAFTKKLLSPETIMKLPQLATIAFTSVKTDVSLTEIPSYFPYIKDFKMDNLHFFVLPGEARYADNISYFFPDVEDVLELVDSIFF